MTKIYYQLLTKIKLEDIGSFSKSIQNHLLLKKNEIKFKESLAGWSLLKQILPNIEFDKLEVNFNKNGKPECKEFFFNISHSRNLIVVGVSNSDIGVDIEYIDFNKDIDELSFRLLNCKVSHSEFYEKFTKKEAYVKYKGLSIGYPKNTLEKDIENVKSEIININDEKYSLSYISEDNEIKINKMY